MQEQQRPRPSFHLAEPRMLAQPNVFLSPLKPKNKWCGLLQSCHIIVAFPQEPEPRGSLGKSSWVVGGRVAQDLTSQGWSGHQSTGLVLEVVATESGSDPGSDSCRATK